MAGGGAAGDGDALVLDQAVRDWVFIPLTVCIVLMKLIMQHLHQARAAPRRAAPRALHGRRRRVLLTARARAGAGIRTAPRAAL